METDEGDEVMAMILMVMVVMMIVMLPREYLTNNIPVGDISLMVEIHQPWTTDNQQTPQSRSSLENHQQSYSLSR